MQTKKEIANTLRDAMSADIWYDAGDHDDKGAAEAIERIQTAMTAAADLLDPTDTVDTVLADIYRRAAKEQHHRDGEIEVDDDAKVSLGDDPGAYVQAWIWVEGKGPTLFDVATGAVERVCSRCGDKTDTEQSPDGDQCPDCHDAYPPNDDDDDDICDECGRPNPDGGDGYDGKCADCADKAELEVTCSTCGLDLDEDHTACDAEGYSPAQHKLTAIRARLNEAFDHPFLREYGPMTGNTNADLMVILNTTLPTKLEAL